MSAIIVIPARMQSSRLPRKMLADIAGKPLIQHAFESATKATKVTAVYVATDSSEIVDVVDGFGGKALLTDPELPSGTARIASIVNELEGENIVNVQGDMPMTPPDLIDDVISAMENHTTDIVTPIWPITVANDIKDPSVAKVVVAGNGRALYFSRSAVPFLRDVAPEEWPSIGQYWGHYGIYGYKRHVLNDIAAGKLAVSILEDMEKLEQLRFLEAGYHIQTINTNYKEIAVDTSAELDAIRKMISDL